MTKKRKLLIAVVGLLVISIAFIGGFVVGSINGYKSYSLVHAPWNSFTLELQLRALRNGEVEDIIEEQEDELNHQIYLRSFYLERKTPKLLDYYIELSYPAGASKAHDDRQFMYRVAKYRREYPIYISVPEFVEGTDEAIVKEVEETIAMKNKKIKETIIADLRETLKRYEYIYARETENRESIEERIKENQELIRHFEDSLKE